MRLQYKLSAFISKTYKTLEIRLIIVDLQKYRAFFIIFAA